MGYAELNGQLTDDVRWPRKVKVVTPLSLGHNISKEAGDTGLFPKDYQKEIAYVEWNGHVTVDVMWAC